MDSNVLFQLKFNAACRHKLPIQLHSNEPVPIHSRSICCTASYMYCTYMQIIVLENQMPCGLLVLSPPLCLS